MDAQQDIPILEEAASASTPYELANGNRWNRDLALACHIIRSLDSHPTCQRCQSIVEAVSQLPALDCVSFEVDPALDDPACGFCNAIKCTERRLNVQFSKYNFVTGEIEPKCLTLRMNHQATSLHHRTIVLCTYSFIMFSPWFDPWPKDPLKVDLQHLKDSLAYCKNHHHGLSCEIPRLPVKELRLLNCKSRVIEPATIRTEYVALSYVWGSSMSRSPSRSEAQSTYGLTIEDAILVTLRFGYTYLWVDQLCIDQRGPHMEGQLRQMDLIYQNADLTIFAVAGESCSHGLPGVTTTSRSPRMSFRNGGTLYYEIKRTARRIVEDSKWDTRAWTFQEWIFSRRRLVFSETEAFFVCNALAPNEERGSECAPSAALLDRQLRPPHIINVGTWEELPTGLESTNPLYTCCMIDKYAKRSLTHSSDTLNAIQGIFRAFQRLESPTYNFWGIPVLDFSYFKKNELQGTDTTLEGFIFGLSWEEFQDEGMFVRESMFPSWTWAGWKRIGPTPRTLEWSISKYKHRVYGCAVTGIYVELSMAA